MIWRAGTRMVVLGISLSGLLALMVGGGACSPPPVKPLAEPLIRLSTTLQGCDAKQPDKPCRWQIQGVIDTFGVASEGDNPFPDCTNCKFDQKFGVLDSGGTRHYIYYKLPTQDVVPLHVGLQVNVLFLSAEKLNQGYAMSMRHGNGNLLFAVTSGAGGTLLSKDDLAQFSITEDTKAQAGEQASECGTKIFRYLLFEAHGRSLRLAPGQSGELSDGNKNNYRLVHINRFNWQGSRCPNMGATPFSYFAFQLAS